MSKNKLKKFCGLAKFLEKNDEDLFHTIQDLCVMYLFKPRKDGLTFLYPSDKKYKQKIINPKK